MASVVPVFHFPPDPSCIFLCAPPGGWSVPTGSSALGFGWFQSMEGNCRREELKEDEVGSLFP